MISYELLNDESRTCFMTNSYQREEDWPKSDKKLVYVHGIHNFQVYRDLFKISLQTTNLIGCLQADFEQISYKINNEITDYFIY